MFATPVSIAAHPKINEWLTQVEKEMRVTLAKLLSNAVQDMAAFKSGKIEQEAFMTWVDKYQVILSLYFETYKLDIFSIFNSFMVLLILHKINAVMDSTLKLVDLLTFV